MLIYLSFDGWIKKYAVEQHVVTRGYINASISWPVVSKEVSDTSAVTTNTVVLEFSDTGKKIGGLPLFGNM